MIIESQYFGCINFYAALIRYNECTIEQNEYFNKMSFRNRCIVVGSNGLINLTVPIDGGRNSKLLMKDVKISYADNWQQQHWKTIISSYSKAPFFEYYNIEVEKLIKKEHLYLLDKNMEILLWTCNILKLDTRISISDEYTKKYEDVTIDFRNKWRPKNYEYNLGEEIKYVQIFEETLGFKRNISILDLIFCEGLNSENKLLLKR